MTKTKVKICKCCRVKLTLENMRDPRGSRVCKPCYSKQQMAKQRSRAAWLNSIKIEKRSIISGSVVDLVFHHIDPDLKEYNLGRPSQYADVRTMDELTKCHVVTRAEHTTIHHVLRGRHCVNPSPEFLSYMAEHYPEISVSIVFTKGHLAELAGRLSQ